MGISTGPMFGTIFLTVTFLLCRGTFPTRLFSTASAVALLYLVYGTGPFWRLAISLGAVALAINGAILATSTRNSKDSITGGMRFIPLCLTPISLPAGFLLTLFVFFTTPWRKTLQQRFGHSLIVIAPLILTTLALRYVSWIYADKAWAKNGSLTEMMTANAQPILGPLPWLNENIALGIAAAACTTFCFWVRPRTAPLFFATLILALAFAPPQFTTTLSSLNAPPRLLAAAALLAVGLHSRYPVLTFVMVTMPSLSLLAIATT